MSTPVPQVLKAIHAVLKALSIEGIAKDQRNSQQQFMFRGIDSVLNALSGHLAANNLLIIPRVTERTVAERETKNGGAIFSVTCRIEYDFFSVEDGSKVTAVLFGEAMDSGDKATNKAMSAAYKYMAIQSFAIPTEAIEQNDADATTPPEVKGQMQQKRESVDRPEQERPPVQRQQAASQDPAPKQEPMKTKHPILTQLETALKKYGAKQDFYAGEVAKRFNVNSIGDIPVAVLPQALLAVMNHQKEALAAAAAKKAAAEKPTKAAGKKAKDVPPPDPENGPDQQVDDSLPDEGLPV